MLNNSTTYGIYDAHEDGSDTVNAESNWWGTIDPIELQTLTYDWNDNATLGTVDYTPFLTAPDTTAPPSPPTNVAAQTGPTTIVLT